MEEHAASREMAMNEGKGDPESSPVRTSVWTGRGRNSEMLQGLEAQGFAGAVPGKNKFLSTHPQKNLYSASSI